MKRSAIKRLAMGRLAVKRSAASEDEAGFVLLAVIFLTVVLLISLAIAAPKIAKSIQRDKELETIHRGEQYKRALKLYYQKFGSYPTSIDQLVQTNQMRFLRRKYKDPLTGKDDWKPVFYGQAHVRPLGFFGQPLMTAGLGGTASMYAVAERAQQPTRMACRSPARISPEQLEPAVFRTRPARLPRALVGRQPVGRRCLPRPRRPPRQDPRRLRPSDQTGPVPPLRRLAEEGPSSASRCRSISHP